jgi:hypothetical protein
MTEERLVLLMIGMVAAFIAPYRMGAFGLLYIGLEL